MAAALRLVAFVLGAMAIEVLRGPGAVVLAGALLVGLLRGPWWLALALGVAGAAVSLALPEGASAGKVAHGLSNAPFVVLLHLALAVLACALGRLARAAVRTRRPAS